MNTHSNYRKLIIVLNRLAGGGAETQVRRLSVALADRGWQVMVVSLLEDVIDAPEMGKYGIRRVNLHGTRGFRAVRLLPGLVKLFRKEAPDVVLTMMIPADPLSRVAGRLAGVPVVSSIRNHFVGGRVVNSLLRVTSRLPALTTVNAHITRIELGPRITSRPNDIELVPNVLDAEAYRSEDEACVAIREELGVTESVFLWLAVGAQRPQKHYKMLLHAFAELPQDSVLAIAGAPYQQEDLSSLADELGISERVWFLGRRDDVPDLLCACDAFVQASLYEGTPNAVLEAMAAQRPVVATAVGGVPDTIEHGLSGWMIPADNVEALRDQMHKVMQLSQLERTTVAERGRAYVERVHSVEAVVRQWEALLCRVTDRTPHLS